MRGIRRTIGKIGGCLILALALGPRALPGADLDPQEVRAAIDAGVRYLKSTQRNNGDWAGYESDYPGVTGLCTLALLSAGVDVKDESIQRALGALRKSKPERTYSVSLQTMALCAAEPERDLAIIRRNVKWLQDTQVKGGDASGGWHYVVSGGADNSNSQFAVLALHEAERVFERFGLEDVIDEAVWRRVLDYWRRGQNVDGSWPYMIGIGRGHGSMTCAGLSSLILAEDILARGDARVENGEIRCCQEHQSDTNIERGLTWLDRHYSVNINPNHAGYYFYYMYALERVGRISARRFIGDDHDWYREGADVLLHTRRPDRTEGFWQGSGHGEDLREVTTAFSLLFLSKGRRPVVISKITHGPGDDWNRHRSDVANLTRHLETLWKRDLTWQVVDLGAAQTAEELLVSPVLFITGRDGLAWGERDAKLLRAYVNQGGFLFFESCCSGELFDRNMRDFLRLVFPEPEYQLRLLEPGHPIWRAEQPIDPKYMKPLYGIDVGCRTSVVYCPEDLGCLWELSRSGRGTRYPESVQELIDAGLALGANVLAYATNRELKYKDEAPLARDDYENSRRPLDRNRLQVAKLWHSGGSDTAPLAISRLVESLGRDLGIPVDPVVPLVRASDPTLYDYHLVFMHGRGDFRFDDLQRERLRTFLERGGTLFADAICSSEAFREAFRREMAEILPGHPLRPIPVSHPLYRADFGGTDIRTVSRREPETGAGGNLRSSVRQAAPDLEGVEIGGRLAVIFSPSDVSCALESHHSLECRGYTREDAARIGTNVILYSLQQ